VLQVVSTEISPPSFFWYFSYPCYKRGLSSLENYLVVAQFFFSEASSRSAGQNVPRLLKHAKFHYRARQNPPLVPILSHFNAVDIFETCFFKPRFNIIAHSMHRLQFGFMFFDKHA
jgi:hypothetical protein